MHDSTEIIPYVSNFSPDSVVYNNTASFTADDFYFVYMTAITNSTAFQTFRFRINGILIHTYQNPVSQVGVECGIHVFVKPNDIVRIEGADISKCSFICRRIIRSSDL